MADEVDIGSLTPDQQAALQQFTAVTDAPLENAVPLLTRCQWNVQIAIARFFDGEPAEDPVAVAAAQAAAAAPQDTRRAENLMNGFGASPRSSTSSRRVAVEPAPRVVPQPESHIDTRAPLVFTLLWAPVSLLYTLLSKYFRFMGYLFPFIPRAWGRVTASNIRSPPSRRSAGRRPLNPRDTAARFIREFEEEYGANDLPFHDGGYASAFDLAKKELKFLLVVLVSPEHDLTSPFLRATLLDPAVVSFLRDPANNILLWAGSVSDSEAYSVSSALGCTKFPFSAVIVHTPSVSSSAMGIATRIAGPASPSQYLAKLRSAMGSHREALDRVRAQRAEQNATRDIRQQQDSAYERSLATDRARKQKAREEAEAAAAAEKAALAAAEAAEKYAADLEQWRKWRAASLPAEPAAHVKDVVRISIRMPNADRVVRKLSADAAMEELYAFVECYGVLQSGESGEGVQEPKDFEHEYAFRLVSPMPREVYEVGAGGTVGERIGRSGNLIVERIGGDESDEE
ncbi:UBX domain-containing protein 10 [Didymella glomerata]|uniref:UBX domain-containing protein 10 n=1 Tax=Didymella glomerata TaxID=749621 RepID=A0A9W8WVP0_9PLEO|nr:UBX domain-containing protein 10 [Didymella glomerata]